MTLPLTTAQRFQLLTTFFFALASLPLHWGVSALVIGVSCAIRWGLEEARISEEFEAMEKEKVREFQKAGWTRR